MESGARTTLLYLLRKTPRDMCVQVCMFVHTHTHIYTDHTHRHGASAGTLRKSPSRQQQEKTDLRADPFRNNSASVTGVS